MRKAPKIKYFVGDVRSVLKKQPKQSIQCIVTSPPYWGLRDYGIPPSIWGGDQECEHEWGAWITDPVHPASRRCEKCQKFGVVKRTTDDNVEIYCVDCDHTTHCKSDTKGIMYEDDKKRWQHTVPNGGRPKVDEVKQGQYCQICGAWRGCLGLEPIPELYIEHMVEVCRGLWRVLRDDGVFFLNMGDSYYSSATGTYSQSASKLEGGKATQLEAAKRPDKLPKGCKPKDLVMMPARLALALQEDGWWVRSKIIWYKRNPMPESCTDRPTSSYEEIFELTKSGKSTYWVNVYRGKGTRRQPKPDYLYFDLKNNITYEDEPKGFDTEAEDKNGKPIWKRENQWKGHDYFYDHDAVREKINIVDGEPGVGRNLRNVWEVDEDEFQQFLRWKAEHSGDLVDVWKIATHPYPAAHFATFPPRIPEICIKAGTSEKGCCSKCGAPWERVVEKELKGGHFVPNARPAVFDANRVADGGCYEGPRQVSASYEVTTKGFQPTCDCSNNTGNGRCVVLDPFAGSGTTLLVGHNMGRDVIGIDISKEYSDQAIERIKNESDFQEPLDTFK